MKKINPLLSGTAANQALRFFATQSTELVQRAVSQHNTSLTASAALGRTLMAASLLAQLLSKQNNERVNVRVDGNGPIGHIISEAERASAGLATVRGYAQHPQADLPARANDGKLDVGGLVGNIGDYSVTRLHAIEDSSPDPLAGPYTGSVPLQSGEIGEDTARYLLESEQIPSAVLLGVLMDATGVAVAGGVIVQAMPGANQTVLAQLEKNLSNLPHLTSLLKAHGLEGALQKIFAGLDWQVNEIAELEWRCRCSSQKALDSLRFFTSEELQEMIAAGGQEVVCHWCNTHYQVPPEEIRRL